MAYYITRIEDGREGSGSDEAQFIYDIKTIRGVKNRVMNSPTLIKGQYRIYSFPEGKQFDEESYRLVGTVRKLKPSKFGR